MGFIASPRDWLVRKWVAEGFASQEEVAQAYFDKLVSMDLLVRPAPHWNKLQRYVNNMKAFLTTGISVFA
jgi:hypothetical protein